MNFRWRYLLGFMTAAAFVLAACNGDEPTAVDPVENDEEVDKPEVVIGVVGGRVGPISNVGVGVGEAVDDWFEMVNARGGIDGREVRLVEIETEYEVPRAVDAYNRMRDDGAVGMAVLGTALSDALLPQSEEDGVPILFPGQGNAELVDGTANPYAFPAAPTYPHQASSLAQWAADDWEDRGESGSPTVTCTAWDNPPGQEFCRGAEQASEELGFDYAVENAVPPGAVDAVPQVRQVMNAEPDYVFHSTVFGQAAAFLSAACEEGLESTVLTWHWAITEEEIAAAGAECLDRLNYTGAFMSAMPVSDPEAMVMLRDHWAEEGEDPNPVSENNQLYGNGLAIANIMHEGLRLADEAAGADEITPEMYRDALRSITDFEGHETLCPTTITDEDHGGNRALNLYQIIGGEFERIDTCVEGPRLPVEPDLGG